MTVSTLSPKPTGSQRVVCTDWNGGCTTSGLTPNQVQVFTFLPGAAYNNYFDTKFYLMVY